MNMITFLLVSVEAPFLVKVKIPSKINVKTNYNPQHGSSRVRQINLAGYPRQSEHRLTDSDVPNPFSTFKNYFGTAIYFFYQPGF